MISYLKGRIAVKRDNYIIVDVQGVGYKVFLAKPLLEKAVPGETTELFCYLHVTETALDLFGVPTIETLEIFERINSISGIGPKTALEFSSFGTLESLHAAIEERGAEVFRGMKGIGKKRIDKIVYELTGMWKQEEKKKAGAEEAVQGLVSLGFSKKEATEALSLVSPDIEETQARIKEALKFLGKR